MSVQVLQKFSKANLNVRICAIDAAAEEEEGMGYGGVKVTTDVIRNLVTWQVIPFSRPLPSHATPSHVVCHTFPNTAPFGTSVTSLQSDIPILSRSMGSMR